MKSLKSFSQLYLYRDPVDMRKQIKGLSVFVQDYMRLDPFCEAVFVFTNKRRNTVKILYWDKTGFALWTKKLEKEKFIWPRKIPKRNISLDVRELEWLLEGFDLTKMKPHQKLKYKKVS